MSKADKMFSLIGYNKICDNHFKVIYLKEEPNLVNTIRTIGFIKPKKKVIKNETTYKENGNPVDLLVSNYSETEKKIILKKKKELGWLDE